MKNLIIAASIIFFSVQLFAQNNLLSGYMENSYNQFYVDLIGKTSALNGDWGLFGGMRAGYNINKNVSIGLAGHGLIPDKLGNSYINRNGRDELHFGYGGAEAGYKYFVSDKLYLAGLIMIGAGRVDYEILNGHDYFFVIEPGTSVNYRITDWFSIGYSVSYRFASGVNYAEFSNASFSGWSNSFDFKFGFNFN